jgi:nucleoid DNA-binding protein
MKHLTHTLPLLLALLILPATHAYAIGEAELAKKMAQTHGVTEAEAKQSVQHVFRSIEAELAAGNPVTIRNFGRFSLRQLGERKGRNPRTGEAINIPAKKYPKFSSSDKLKAAVNVAG